MAKQSRVRDELEKKSVEILRALLALHDEGTMSAAAQRLGISLAELLRRSLRTMLPADESKPWMRYAGMIESGDPKSSQRIDEIVYGQKP